jgi:hypothetical protein
MCHFYYNRKIIIIFLNQNDCNYFNCYNIYIANTKIEENDTKEILVKKMISILSYHEKAGVWKR